MLTFWSAPHGPLTPGALSGLNPSVPTGLFIGLYENADDISDLTKPDITPRPDISPDFHLPSVPPAVIAAVRSFPTP